MTIMLQTQSKKRKQAKRSCAKQRPARKYATLNMTTNKSDIFVLWECSRNTIFIFG